MSSSTASCSLRGIGAPIADLAGNVWEWTLPAVTRVDLDGEAPGPFPSPFDAVFIRGGNFRSAALSLSNAFNRIPVAVDDVPGALPGRLPETSRERASTTAR